MFMVSCVDQTNLLKHVLKQMHEEFFLLNEET